MGNFRIIPPQNNEKEFYNYVYKITLDPKSNKYIPKKCFTDLISYFEKVEDYEKCKTLYDIIQENEENI